VKHRLKKETSMLSTFIAYAKQWQPHAGERPGSPRAGVPAPAGR
jgi:hypothetical protein